ncbi:ankyrin repeat domain-containing protein [Ruminobacter sp.]|uniref:ankyrin repeat domain-containing protein n=1 Tax=Ruminobacter sp. TaxID=2774296 RepID=UPI00386C10F0
MAVKSLGYLIGILAGSAIMTSAPAFAENPTEGEPTASSEDVVESSVISGESKESLNEASPESVPVTTETPAADTGVSDTPASGEVQPEKASEEGEVSPVPTGEEKGVSGEEQTQNSERNYIEVMPPNDFMMMVRQHDEVNDQKIIQALADGMDPNTRRVSDNTPYGDPALYTYINTHGRNPEVVRAFIDAGVDLLWHNDNGEYKVLQGLFYTDEDLILYALELNRPDLSRVSMGKKPPIIEFLDRDSLFFKRSDSMETSLKLLDTIISLGGLKYDHDDVNDPRNQVLKYALTKDRDNRMWPASVLQKLIDAGAAVNVRDKYEKTPLFDAIESNAVEHINVLARNGADMNATNRRGSTALIEFMDNDSVTDETLKILVDLGTDVNHQAFGRNNLTALIEAVKEERIGMVEYLLKHGAKPDLQVKNGKTALIFAIMKDNEEKRHTMMNMLLDAGASPEKADRDGIYPLCYAIGTGSVKTADLLVSRGADLEKAVNTKESAKKGKSQRTLYDVVMGADNTGAVPMQNYLKEKLGR